MRISDWSSDVALPILGERATANALGASAFGQGANASAAGSVALDRGSLADQDNTVSVGRDDATTGFNRRLVNLAAGEEDRSDDSRVGKGCVSQCSTRGSP